MLVPEASILSFASVSGTRFIQTTIFIIYSLSDSASGVNDFERSGIIKPAPRKSRKIFRQLPCGDSHRR